MIIDIVIISMLAIPLGFLMSAVYQAWKAYRLKVKIVKEMWKFDPIRHMPKDEENELC